MFQNMQKWSELVSLAALASSSLLHFGCATRHMQAICPAMLSLLPARGRREKAPFLLFIEVINEPRPGEQPVSDTGAAASGDIAQSTANGLHGNDRRASHDAVGPGTHRRGRSQSSVMDDDGSGQDQLLHAEPLL